MHSEHLHFINMHHISINSCMQNLHVIKLLVFSELCNSKKEERVSSNPPLFLRLYLFHVTLPMTAADCSIQPPLSLLQPIIRLKLSHTCLHRLLASMLDCVYGSIIFPVLTWSCYSRCCGCLSWHFNLVPMLHEFPVEAQEDLRHLIIVFCIIMLMPNPWNIPVTVLLTHKYTYNQFHCFCFFASASN